MKKFAKTLVIAGQLLSKFLLAVALIVSWGQSQAITCANLNGAYLVSQEFNQVYLGFFGNSFASESVNNSFGTYGSSFSSLSVRNTFGNYGSSFGIYSANNNFTSTPPFIVKYGNIIGYLTTNSSIYEGVSLAVVDANCSFTASTPSVSLPTTYLLSVVKSGAGSGSVTSSPSGINCGRGCNNQYASYAHNTIVTLYATPSAGSIFAGWTGECSGTGTCQVTMNSVRGVTANFNIVTQTKYILSVNKLGSGSGTVISSPAGINCGNDCSQSYNASANITLYANPSSGSKFTGWSGACSGKGSCQVTMNGAKTVKAVFGGFKAIAITPILMLLLSN